VLVVVEDRDVEALAQPGLDLEAARGRDVLEVDAAEAGGDHLHGLDDLVGVLAGQADRPGVDVGEPLEERRLALHHRQRGAGADVAQAEHRGAVGHHGHAVALDRQPAHVVGVVGQRLAHPADPGGVGHREVVAGAQRHLGGDLDLAADVEQEGAVADLVDDDALDLVDGGHDLLGVVGVGGGAGDVDDEPGVARLRDVDGGDDAALLGDDGRDLAHHPVVGVGVQPHGDRVRRGRGGHGDTLPPVVGYQQVANLRSMREVTDNTAESRYELHLDGEVVGIAEYRRHDDHITFTHTEVDDGHEGEGLGSFLSRAVLDAARDAGLAVHPACPFVARYVKRHPHPYLDLVPEQLREKYGVV
jgi:predicted GNAT family acetyltransferase